MIESYEMPIVVNGKITYEGSKIYLKYAWKRPVEVSFPALRKSYIENILGSKNILEETNINEIISFLDEVGTRWRKKNYHLREEAIEIAEKITGYHRRQLELSFDLIGKSLTEKNLEATVRAELGSKHILEKWIRKECSEVKVFPRGKILHILAGNVPEVGVLSLVRGILSKNINILKLSSKDPVSTLYFVLSFRDVDPSHPVTLTTSALYWERNDPKAESLLSSVDAICVWGGKNALEYARKRSKPGQIIVEFGPKKSVQFIDRRSLENERELKKLAKKSAHDLLLHDQRACNSPFVIFVEGNPSSFCKLLADALKEEDKKLPRGFLDPELMSTISELRQLSTILGDKVMYSSYNWTIIWTRDIRRALKCTIPSSRIVFVAEIQDLRKALKYIDSSIMVVAFSSISKLKEMRDMLSRRGVERLTEIGKMGYPQVGFTSGWVYPISLLVRWVCRDLTHKELSISIVKPLETRWVRFL